MQKKKKEKSLDKKQNTSTTNFSINIKDMIKQDIISKSKFKGREIVYNKKSSKIKTIKTNNKVTYNSKTNLTYFFKRENNLPKKHQENSKDKVELMLANEIVKNLNISTDSQPNSNKNKYKSKFLSLTTKKSCFCNKTIDNHSIEKVPKDSKNENDCPNMVNKPKNNVNIQKISDSKNLTKNDINKSKSRNKISKQIKQSTNNYYDGKYVLKIAPRSGISKDKVYQSKIGYSTLWELINISKDRKTLINNKKTNKNKILNTTKIKTARSLNNEPNVFTSDINFNGINYRNRLNLNEINLNSQNNTNSINNNSVYHHCTSTNSNNNSNNICTFESVDTHQKYGSYLNSNHCRAGLSNNINDDVVRTHNKSNILKDINYSKYIQSIRKRKEVSNSTKKEIISSYYIKKKNDKLYKVLGKFYINLLNNNSKSNNEESKNDNNNTKG